jgi:hypothetical protein
MDLNYLSSKMNDLYRTKDENNDGLLQEILETVANDPDQDLEQTLLMDKVLQIIRKS